MKSISLFSARLINAVLVAAAVIIISACSRTPPLENIVDASSDSRLLLWKMDVAGDFTRQEWQDFEDAVQEIKFGVMIAGEASGSAAIWSATLEKMDGLTVREVLKLGLGRKLARLTQERDKFVGYVTNNDQLRVAPGDGASLDYLQTLRMHQDRRITILTEQIRVTEEILQRRGITLENSAPKAPKRASSAPF